MKYYCVTLSDRAINDIQGTLTKLKEAGFKSAHVFKYMGIIVGQIADPKLLKRKDGFINVEEEEKGIFTND